MLLAFGNLFLSKMTFCCEGLCFPQTDILCETFPLKWFQPTILQRSSWEHSAAHSLASQHWDCQAA